MRRRIPTTAERFRLPALTAGLLAAGVLTNVHAQIQAAGELFVDVDATGLATGALNSITNRGTLHGNFVAVGPVPSIATTGGTKGILLNGADALQLQDDSAAPILAPAAITGNDPTHSIEVWALNPDLANEETMVSWGHRGDPAGSNVSFNYGSDFRWGAIGHWGNADIGWNDAGGGPTANKWHHLVYTYDGTTTRVYADGVLQNGEYLGPGAINTFADTYLLIGAQSDTSGAGIQPDLRFSGTIGRVRVHDGVLTPEQILNNYNLEKTAFIDPTTTAPAIQPARLTTGPIHRYSFANTAGTAVDGVEITDSVGTANGNVRGAGATFSGSQLSLPGGSSATQAYVDLPNGLLSSHSTNNAGTGQFSIESWYRVTGSQNWGRVFDFGSSGTVDGTEEVLGPGGGNEGRDYFMYSAQNGGDVNTHRLELRNEDPAGGGQFTVDNPTSTFGREVHTLVTWDEATGRLIVYENGLQVSTMTVPTAMSDINDIDVWLGRSNWAGDSNAQIDYNDVRIYDYVLSPQLALGNAMAGPDQLNNHDFAPSIVSDPQSASVPQGQSTTFTAGAYGSSPLTFQWYRDGVAIADATNRTLTVSNVTINDNNAAFTFKASNTVNGSPQTATSAGATLTVLPPTDRLTVGPVHRWSFNEAAGDAIDATVKDSVGTADGVVLGDGATFTGTRVVLPGGSSASAAYVDLPNGLLSSNGVANAGSGKFTFETWMKVTGSFNWSRVFDFGSSGSASGTEEVTGPGGGNEGRDYFMYSAENGTDVNTRRLEVRNEDPGGGGITTVDNTTATFGQDMHIVVTWDEASGRLIAYENGRQVSTTTTPIKMSDINDIDVWLGRSNWTGDSNLQGEYEEVRMYDTVLSQRQVLGNFQAGYNVINDHDVAPVLVKSPSNLITLEGGNATFTADAQGSTPMAFQWFRNGQPIAGAISSTLTVTNVTTADNNASFTVRVSNTVNGAPASVTSDAAVLTVNPNAVVLKHRYSFSETTGTNAVDSVGGANGEAIGGATFGGGQITLDGVDGYVNLPNGVISGLGQDATIELWFTMNAPVVWTRVFDFGTSTLGEDQPDAGQDYLFFTARDGDGIPRFTANFPGGGDVVSLVPQPGGTILNQQKHVAIVWSASKNTSRMYFDGVLVSTGTAPRPISDLAGSDLNNWLGRSQFVADAFWAGSYNELRLTSGAMSADQVAASFAAGPDAGNSGSGPTLSVAQNAGNIILTWPAAATGFTLQTSPVLGTTANWTTVPAVQNGANMQATVPTTGSAAFFRLIGQ
jgi:hypothetical protein